MQLCPPLSLASLPISFPILSTSLSVSSPLHNSPFSPLSPSSPHSFLLPLSPFSLFPSLPPPTPPPPSPLRMEHSTSIPSSSYEFPNGYNLNATVEKFKITEGLFNAATANLKVQLLSSLSSALDDITWEHHPHTYTVSCGGPPIEL